MLIFKNDFLARWCWGVAISIVVMLFVKLLLGRPCTGERTLFKKFFCVIKMILKAIVRALCWIVSLDYYISKLQKEKIKSKYPSVETEDQVKNNLGKYIKKHNKLNLYASLIIVGIASVVAIFSISVLWQIFFGLLCYRTLSRTMEINIAFFNDIIDTTGKSSDLTSQDRIKLAGKSLIEEFLLFFGIYQLLQCYNIGYIKRLFFALFNASRSFLPTFPSLECSRLFNGICIYQNICGFILISLSLITYISQLGDKSPKTNKDESTNSSEEETKNSD